MRKEVSYFTIAARGTTFASSGGCFPRALVPCTIAPNAAGTRTPEWRGAVAGRGPQEQPAPSRRLVLKLLELLEQAGPTPRSHLRHPVEVGVSRPETRLIWGRGLDENQSREISARFGQVSGATHRWTTPHAAGGGGETTPLPLPPAHPRRGPLPAESPRPRGPREL